MKKHEESHLHCQDAAVHWEQLETRVHKAWQFSDQMLDEARPELRKRMVELDTKFTEKPVFSSMPTLASYDFLWVLFLVDGEPGSTGWQKTGKDHSVLRPLGLRDLYVVIASIELEIAAFALLEHAHLARKGDDNDIEAAMHALEAAVACLGSAEKALELAENQVPQGAASHLH